MTEQHAHELKFAFSDFITLLKRHQRTVLIWMAISALLTFTYAITRPVNYIVKATFRDKGKAQVGLSSGFSDLFFNKSGSQESEASTTMKSRVLISQAIRDLNLQGFIAKQQTEYPELKNSWESLLSEYAQWMQPNLPILNDPHPDFLLEQITYNGEIPVSFTLKWIDQDRFEILGAGQIALGIGSIGQPFHAGSAQFTVVKNSAEELSEPDPYDVVIFPLSAVAAAYANLLQIDVDKEDKTLLKLQFRHRNRDLASRFLNRLMENFQAFQESQHELTANTQLSYLKRRQNEVGADLQQLMENHVQKVSEDMARSGFTSLQKEMEFLAASLASNQEKIQEIDLETRRLSNIDPNACVHYDAYTTRGDPAIINNWINEMRALKQESDSLEVALQMASDQAAPAKERINSHFVEIQKTQKCSQEASQLAAWIRNKGQDSFHLQTLKNEPYPVASWLESLKEKERSAAIASPQFKKQKELELGQFKEQLLAYLDNFEHLLKIRETTLAQRMRTLQDPQAELEGINLSTARELYINFTKELNDIGAQHKQHEFVAKQLENPDFEVCSLTALLNDPISQERIAKASQLMIQIKDENNRTQREIERLKTELALQKQFLKSHILQIAELLALKENMLKEKVSELQGITLEQIHQKTSLLKKNLTDYVESRIQNLNQEKRLLAEHQQTLQARMTEIPEKWASEQLLNQNLAMQQRFLENLAGMVESKNISKNLEMVQSSALDTAIPTLNPKPPRLIFFTILGAILGFFGSSCFLFTRTMIQGIPASKENLTLACYHVSGAITPFQGDESTAAPPYIDSDLDTLRRLIANIETKTPSSSKARSLLLIKGEGTDFTNTLAVLLSKKGQKILKLSLDFTTASEKEGLLQYLESDAANPRIEKLAGFDWISSGGASRYSEELLRSPRFQSLLKELSSRYDWILATTPATLPSAEAENLSCLFDASVVVVTHESLNTLIGFSEALPPEKEERLSFVFS